MVRLDNKVCIITGASSGIGYVTAKRFAEEGAILTLFARRAERLEELAKELKDTYGTEVLVVAGDAKNLEDIRRCVDGTAEKFGRIDVLINNAGRSDYHRPITKVTDDFWDEVMDVDLKSVFRFTRETLRYMEPAGKGSIVSLSSIGGYYGNMGFTYSVAKAGIIAMMKNIAIQFTGKGIRANSVAPGNTLTEFNTEEELAKFDQELSHMSLRHLDVEAPPCGVLDQANALLYLACDESASTTGQCLVVDNGACL